jgi:ABC-type Fe3+/spermidine/putrescine transport system ATPase subunit
MILLAVNVGKKVGAFKLAARFEAAGGITAVFGPSGGGKTTLVRLIAGLLKPDRGSIALDDTVLFTLGPASIYRRTGVISAMSSRKAERATKYRLWPPDERASARQG